MRLPWFPSIECQSTSPFFGSVIIADSNLHLSLDSLLRFIVCDLAEVCYLWVWGKFWTAISRITRSIRFLCFPLPSRWFCLPYGWPTSGFDLTWRIYRAYQVSRV